MIRIVFACALMAGCTQYSADIPTSPTDRIYSVAEMPGACRHEAAARYAQLEGNIIMQPAVQDTSGGYSVSGNYATTNVQHTIGCRFTPDGRFMGLGRV